MALLAASLANCMAGLHPARLHRRRSRPLGRDEIEQHAPLLCARRDRDFREIQEITGVRLGPDRLLRHRISVYPTDYNTWGGGILRTRCGFAERTRARSCNLGADDKIDQLAWHIDHALKLAVSKMLLHDGAGLCELLRAGFINIGRDLDPVPHLSVYLNDERHFILPRESLVPSGPRLPVDAV